MTNGFHHEEKKAKPKKLPERAATEAKPDKPERVKGK